MQILLVFCHPRRSSLTGAIAGAFREGAESAGHRVEWADLYGEEFDPVLRPDDEPDRTMVGKRYSDAVQLEMARLDRNDAIVMVFPVWWWSMPAMLKGWIDRVWNRDYAYGSRKLHHSHGLMLAVASSSEDAFAKRGYDTAAETQLNLGIMSYCGIKQSRLELLHGSTADDGTRTHLIARARALGEQFPVSAPTTG